MVVSVCLHLSSWVPWSSYLLWTHATSGWLRQKWLECFAHVQAQFDSLSSNVVTALASIHGQGILLGSKSFARCIRVGADGGIVFSDLTEATPCKDVSKLKAEIKLVQSELQTWQATVPEPMQVSMSRMLHGSCFLSVMFDFYHSNNI